MSQLVSNRPWGKFIQYCQNEPVTVKIISVNPGEVLSVQYHYNRDELWVALDPGLLARIGDDLFHFYPNEELFVSRKTTHSVENQSSTTARFLEICFGEFDENDIVRLADKYGRR